MSFGNLSQTYKAFSVQISNENIPASISEALASHECRKAVFDEFHVLKKNNTWDISQLPKGKIPVGRKYVFNLKYKANGSIDRYKARLVANGFTQTFRIDYNETFALVAKLNTI